MCVDRLVILGLFGRYFRGLLFCEGGVYRPDLVVVVDSRVADGGALLLRRVREDRVRAAPVREAEVVLLLRGGVSRLRLRLRSLGLLADPLDRDRGEVFVLLDHLIQDALKLRLRKGDGGRRRLHIELREAQAARLHARLLGVLLVLGGAVR